MAAQSSIDVVLSIFLKVIRREFVVLMENGLVLYQDVCVSFSELNISSQILLGKYGKKWPLEDRTNAVFGREY